MHLLVHCIAKCTVMLCVVHIHAHNMHIRCTLCAHNFISTPHIGVRLRAFQCATSRHRAALLQSSHWQESQSRENLEKKWVKFFSLELEKWFFISLFPLDFQDLEKKILFLFSIYEIFKKNLFHFSMFEILKKNFSFSSRFMRFC